MNEAPVPPPRAFGDAVLTAQIRSVPEDFFVEEVPAFEPAGEGEHLLLTIEKRGLNTAFVAKELARWAKIPEMGIGYAGLKDRNAVTRQRFSVHLPKKIAPEFDSLYVEGLKILESCWHNRKLPRGALAGNRFVLVLREVSGEREAIQARLSQIAARGIPNAYGEQRFGRGGGNIAQALAMFDGRRMRREQRSLLLSAARSELFNRVLAARVAQNCWDTPLDGEVWVLDGSRSVFGPEPWNDDLARRLAEFDIHPSGPLWGEGELRSRDACERLERDALDDDLAHRLRAGLEQAGLKQERRALRLRVDGLQWAWPEEAVLQLEFGLPPGSYATALLHELGRICEPSG
ncbi:tRNA pseudouridine(13) synthase TruD [Pseudoxanthomonas kalamensis DSM 18571]|uniref:tRNA pseudouridine(13) synthase TruD n=1 Tax=Pseudoxanthomonas kalamensis TaxID=289483 RepID=UPI0013917B29|nr:tRNA pseudouridine(13) synthase TruD [Pseudoxanthomonas kalamensis]KAF1711204.1 tRNA pseudouridine(13) synthase TruD [Pseudoxanthomonas kalamensis DSM 18571]